MTDYKPFALDVLKAIPDRPVSFEVFADDFPTMEAQAREIASWGDNVYVKIPVTNTKGDFCRAALIATLSRRRHQAQCHGGVDAMSRSARSPRRLAEETPAVVSVFAGRIADTGRDPVPLMRERAGAAQGPAEGRASLGQPA